MTTFTADGKAALDARIVCTPRNRLPIVNANWPGTCGQKEAVESVNIPGFNIGVSNVDEEIYFNGGGPHAVGDPTSPDVNPDSIFWICSQTKLITAVRYVFLHLVLRSHLPSQLAALKLIEQGRVSYDTLVADYIPQLRNPVIVDESSTDYKPAQTPITLKHLLNFTSGLFYPPSTEASLDLGYTSKEMHVAEDPLSQWLNIVQVCCSGLYSPSNIPSPWTMVREGFLEYR